MALLMIVSHAAACCELVEPPVKGALKRAEVVFSGVITDVRPSELVFRVDRVWKGQIPKTFVMPRITWSETPCMPGFYSGWVKEGAAFLVYARRLPSLNINGYVPEAGSRTRLLENATADLKMLGPGRPASP